MAALGSEPCGLPSGERIAARAQRSAALEGADEIEHSRGRAGGGDLRPAPGQRGIGRLDHRAQEHPLNVLLPPEPALLLALRYPGISTRLNTQHATRNTASILRALALRLCAGAVEPVGAGPPAAGAAGRCLVAARAGGAQGSVADHSVLRPGGDGWLGLDLVPGSPGDWRQHGRCAERQLLVATRGSRIGRLVLSVQGGAAAEPNG